MGFSWNYIWNLWLKIRGFRIGNFNISRNRIICTNLLRWTRLYGTRNQSLQY